MDALELRGVTVRYGAQAALDRVDLAVAPGEHVALIGPNGSGKTTLLRALAGIVRPDSGEVRPAGALARDEVARRIAFLPQEEHWEFPFPVEEVVACGRYAHAPGSSRERRGSRGGGHGARGGGGRGAPAAADHGALGRRAAARDARAGARAAGGALLLDEPTSALDLEHRHAILGALRALRGSVVLATHDLDAAAAWASRIVVLAGGRIVADGPPAQILTEALLREVFRVEARILREGGRIHVVA